MERKERKHKTKENHPTITGDKKKKKKDYKNAHKTSNKMSVSTYCSIITLNVNELNAPNKRHRVGDSIRKQDLNVAHKRLRAKDRLKERE